MEKQIITIKTPEGLDKEVEIVSIVPSEREDKAYLVYTDVDANEKEMVDIYIAIIYEDSEGFDIKAIETDEEYLYAKSLLEAQIRE